MHELADPHEGQVPDSSVLTDVHRSTCHRCTELRGEMHPAWPGDLGQVPQRELCGEMIVDILQDIAT